MLFRSAVQTADPGEPAPALVRDFSQSLPMALLRAREAVMARLRPMLRAHGVTEQQWRVLRALSETDEMDAGELAQAICLRMPSLSRILADLNERRLVQKHLGADRRLRIVRATRQGRALVERLSPLSEQQYRRIEAALGAKHYRRLMKDLDTLIARLSVNETEGSSTVQERADSAARGQNPAL